MTTLIVFTDGEELLLAKSVTASIMSSATAAGSRPASPETGHKHFAFKKG